MPNYTIFEILWPCVKMALAIGGIFVLGAYFCEYGESLGKLRKDAKNGHSVRK